MTSRRDDPDRHLVRRYDKRYQYKRRVPKAVAHLDSRAPVIRISLKTADTLTAQKKRDEYEEADNALWAQLLGGDDKEAAVEEYKRAVKRAEARGFAYRPGQMIAEGSHDDLFRRLEAILDRSTPITTAHALLGNVEIPAETVTAAFKVYCDEIVWDELQGKSPSQLRNWKEHKERAVNNFVTCAGSDLPMKEITKDHAVEFYKFWLSRIAPKEGTATHVPSTGNRDLGNMRVLYFEYFKYRGGGTRPNPFDNLHFEEGEEERKRPPFPTEWIRDVILAPGKLAGLNAEARAVVLIMVETGCRPVEICNLLPQHIKLDAPVPYMQVRPVKKGDHKRETKTQSSIRDIPLIGISLAAMQKFPGGFPRYRDRSGEAWSSTVQKFFETNDLAPAPAEGERRCTAYSLRHSFEDRMKQAKIDYELRIDLMGHTSKRPEYGTGGGMPYKRDQLMKIMLPFDPSIV